MKKPNKRSRGAKGHAKRTDKPLEASEEPLSTPLADLPQFPIAEEVTDLEMIHEEFEYVECTTEYILHVANEDWIVFPRSFIRENEKIVSRLREVLNQVIRDKRIKQTRGLKYFLRALDSFNTKYEIVNGRVEPYKVLNSKKTGKAMALGYATLVLGEEVAYPCSLEQFSNGLIVWLNQRASDLERIRRCRCKRYFLALKSDERIRFCPTCSPKSKMTKSKRRRYQRVYRNKQRRRSRTENSDLTQSE